MSDRRKGEDRAGRARYHLLSIGPQVCHNVHGLKGGVDGVAVPDEVFRGLPGDNVRLEFAALPGRESQERVTFLTPHKAPEGDHRGTFSHWVSNWVGGSSQ